MSTGRGGKDAGESDLLVGDGGMEWVSDIGVSGPGDGVREMVGIGGKVDGPAPRVRCSSSAVAETRILHDIGYSSLGKLVFTRLAWPKGVAVLMGGLGIFAFARHFMHSTTKPSLTFPSVRIPCLQSVGHCRILPSGSNSLYPTYNEWLPRVVMTGRFTLAHLGGKYSAASRS